MRIAVLGAAAWGWVEGGAAVGGVGDLSAVVVNAAVVMPAQQGEVVGGGGAAGGLVGVGVQGRMWWHSHRFARVVHPAATQWRSRTTALRVPVDQRVRAELVKSSV